MRASISDTNLYQAALKVFPGAVGRERNSKEWLRVLSADGLAQDIGRGIFRLQEPSDADVA
jgi:hypothetical protein